MQPATVCLRSLPAPDTLVPNLPPGSHCLVSGDGTDLTGALVHRLRDRGWSVVVLHPSGVVNGGDVPPALPADVPCISLDGGDETAVRSAVAEAATHGPVGAVIYLHPSTSIGEGEPDQALNMGTLGPEDALSLRAPFLLAKHLQPTLSDAAGRGTDGNTGAGRACFLTVTRMDGALGMTGAIAGSPAAGGVSGVTKTLRLEWPEVFCRAVDLDPEMAAPDAADAILDEIDDPNRLIAEVGVGKQGRVTLDTGEGPWARTRPEGGSGD